MEKLKVNEEVCIGCGACFSEYQNHLEMNEEGLARVIPEKEEVTEELAEEIVNICPVGAISSEK